MKRQGTKTQSRKVTSKKVKVKNESDLFTFYFLLVASNSLRLGFLILLFAFATFAQELPDEIRGYKVHNTKISVTSKIDKTERDDRNKSEAYARLTEPELIDTSLTGLTFEISAEIEPLEYKGKIDFLTFKDFKVNGLAVEIDEYTNSFEFKKNQTIRMPKPVKIFLGTGQALKGALGELRDSKEEWTVTGTVFVFGRFHKWGFNFKRVVPVPVSVKIKNPIKTGSVLPIQIPSN